MLNTNYNGSGFIGNRNVSKESADSLGSKISKFKSENLGKLSEEHIHNLIRTAASDDGVVSQQEMDWINHALESQGQFVSKLNINKADFGSAVQFSFSLKEKNNSNSIERSFKSEDIQKEAGKNIGEKHKTNVFSGNITNIKANDLSSLSTLTQKMSKSPYAEDKCGASCIVAGAIYSNGREGLKKLVEATLKMAKAPFSFSEEYIALSNKLKDISKPVTKEDISKLQDMVHLFLTNMQSDKMRESGKSFNTNGGIHSTVLKDFVNSSEMKGVLSNSLKIQNIDISGDGQTDHFTLFISDNDKNSAVFDPYPRKDGKQIITSKKEVDTYRAAISDS